jgi:hypothetical protein
LKNYVKMRPGRGNRDPFLARIGTSHPEDPSCVFLQDRPEGAYLMFRLVFIMVDRLMPDRKVPVFPFHGDFTTRLCINFFVTGPIALKDFHTTRLIAIKILQTRSG